jgi:lipopolysaccharide biosynthesis protein
MAGPKVHVFLWLYHTDLWPEFLSILKPVQDLIYVHLGLCEDSKDLDIISNEFYSNLNGQIGKYPNIGADVRPFLHQISNIQESQVSSSLDVFIKIHSKKSHIVSTINWRSILLSSIFSTRENFLSNIDQFLKPDVGMLTTKGLILSHREGLNGQKIETLCNMNDINYYSVQGGLFPAGNMFLGRLSLFRKYFTAECLANYDKLLEKESGKVTDKTIGKYCHALERMFGYIVSANQSKILPCKENIIMIPNKELPNKPHKLVVMYNKECYLYDNIFIYGRVLNQTETDIEISWHNTNPITIKSYQILL